MALPKLKQFEEMLKLLDNSLTKEEFVSAFKIVVEMVQKLKKTNEEEFILMHDALKKLTQQVKDDSAYDVQEAKKTVERMAVEALKKVSEKLKAVKDGKKGDKGDRGEKGEDGYTPIKGYDYFDGKDGEQGPPGKDGAAGTTVRVGWGAHPLTVMATGVAIDKNTRFIDFRGAGVSSVTRSANGVLTVTIGGGGAGSTVETPTGTVNASNTTFTPSAEPQYVVADGITYFDGAGYTWGGTDIVMDIPPSVYIRVII